jgi:hypothetical protein
MPYTRAEEGDVAFPPLTREPAGAAEVVIGEPLGVGLHQDWTVLAFRQHEEPDANQGIVLIVRPHRYHPFVTERIGWREGDNAFIVWSGTYHEALPEAWDTFLDRSGWRDPSGPREWSR